MIWKFTAFAIALSLALAPASATKPAVSVEDRVEALTPGRWVWRPERATEGDLAIVVSLPLQRAYVYRGDVLIGGATVSSGMPGYETPTGAYRILQKREQHASNLYDAAPMPFMQRLTWDGVALHGGSIPGGPASHGCIRLPRTFAAKLYEVTELGARVLIVDESPAPDEAFATLQLHDSPLAVGGPEAPVEDEPTQ